MMVPEVETNTQETDMILEHATHFTTRAKAEECADANNRFDADEPQGWTFVVKPLGPFWVVVAKDEDGIEVGAL